MNDPVIIKAAACVPVDVLLCTLLVFLVLLLQVFTCLSDIWPRASSCWANAGTFAVVLIKNVLLVLSVFQATLTSSEDGSTGNLTLLTWTLWRATLATSAWISSAAETGDSESEDLFVFLQWSSLFFCLFGFLEQRHFYLWRKIQRRRKCLLWICLSFIYWYTDQVHLLLRKTKLYSLRLGTSCAAILIFILHIFVTVRLSSGPLSNDVCCELHTSHLLSLSRKVRFWSADCPP